MTRRGPPLVRYDYIVDPTGWNCIALDVVVPGEDGREAALPNDQPCVVPVGVVMSVLEYCLRKGFKGWTLSQLKDLYQGLGCTDASKSTRAPAAEKGVLAGLSKHILEAKFDDASLAYILKERCAANDIEDEVLRDSPLLADDPTGFLAEVMEEEALDEELKDVTEKMKDLKARMMVKVASLISGAASSSAGAAPAPSNHQKKPALRPEGMTSALAKQFLPPCARSRRRLCGTIGGACRRTTSRARASNSPRTSLMVTTRPC